MNEQEVRNLLGLDDDADLEAELKKLKSMREAATFADAIDSIMAKDSSLEYRDAVMLACDKYPKLAQEYSTNIPKV